MAGQLPRPWFRLGSITRPASAPTAPVPEPRPPFVRPPIIRPSALTEPSEPTTPPQSAAAAPSSIPALPRPTAATTSVPSSPAAAAAKLSNTLSSLPASPAKKTSSPPATTFTKPVLPLPSPDPKQRTGSVHSATPQKAASPPATTPTIKSSPFSTSEPKQRTSLPPSPTNTDSATNATFTARAPSPAPSPTIAKSKPNSPSPFQSPKPKHTASPPSPLTLPPSQLQSVGEPKHNNIPQEEEQKTVVAQKIKDKTSQTDHFASHHAHKPAVGQNAKQEPRGDVDQGKEKGMRAKKNLWSDQETNMRVITIAGENRGASMEVIFSKKNKSHQISRNDNDGENEEDKLNNPSDKGKKSKEILNSLPMKAFFNSNVQGINNSILLDSSFTHRDPGIHLVLYRKPPSANKLDDEQQS